MSIPNQPPAPAQPPSPSPTGGPGSGQPTTGWVQVKALLTSAYGLVLALGGAGLFALLYTIGVHVGEKGVQEQVNRVEATYQRDLAAKEEKLRECDRTVSQLNIAARLAEMDKERLLQATAVEPPLGITTNGRPLPFEVTIQFAEGSGRFEKDIWLENTGIRDIVVQAIEITAPADYYCGRGSSERVSASGDRQRRGFVFLDQTIPPGGSHVFGLDCWTDNSTPTSVVAELKVTANGFLPKQATFKMTLIRAKPG